MGRSARPKELPALDALASEARWRECIGRGSTPVIFPAKEPVSRDVLARVVDPHCNLDLLIADIRAELRGRPHDLVVVARAHLQVSIQ
jgi:hypothetical protein